MPKYPTADLHARIKVLEAALEAQRGWASKVQKHIQSLEQALARTAPTPKERVYGQLPGVSREEWMAICDAAKERGSRLTLDEQKALVEDLRKQAQEYHLQAAKDAASEQQNIDDNSVVEF